MEMVRLHTPRHTNGLEKTPAVLYYVVGDTKETNAPGNFWRTADSWPPFKVKPRELYLTADFKLSKDSSALPSRSCTLIIPRLLPRQSEAFNSQFPLALKINRISNVALTFSPLIPMCSPNRAKSPAASKQNSGFLRMLPTPIFSSHSATFIPMAAPTIYAKAASALVTAKDIIRKSCLSRAKFILWKLTCGQPASFSTKATKSESTLHPAVPRATMLIPTQANPSVLSTNMHNCPQLHLRRWPAPIPDPPPICK